MSIVRTTVDDRIYNSASDMLATLGLDVNGAVRMFLQGKPCPMPCATGCFWRPFRYEQGVARA